MVSLSEFKLSDFKPEATPKKKKKNHENGRIDNLEQGDGDVDGDGDFYEDQQQKEVSELTQFSI